MRPFNFVAPRTLDDAIQTMADAQGGARALAGGTDLVDQMRTGRKTAALVLDVKKVPEMQRLEYISGEGLHVGAGVSCTRIAEYPPVGEHYPSIRESCLLIGSVQIQNRATIGGNVCNAAPSADTVPPLLTYGAKAIIASPQGGREVLLEEFFLGPGQTVLRPGELLVEVLVPPPEPNSSGHYLRFIPREEMDIAVVGAAAMVVLDPDSRLCSGARIVLAAVAPTPVRARETETALKGNRLTGELVGQAAELAPEAARPINDIRGSIGYRKELCKVLTRRALEACIADLET